MRFSWNEVEKKLFLETLSKATIPVPGLIEHDDAMLLL
jgi:hypothetical protein